MRIFLIRHGETVDNIANVYAGVRDSALTVHGSLQADRLAKHFGDQGLRFKYIFSSDLQRAFKTANAIRLAQSDRREEIGEQGLEVIALPVLREQDFGYYEGKPFYARTRDSNKSGKDSHRSQHQDEPGFNDVESKEAIILRTSAFLKEHLLPIIREEAPNEASAVAIISHGILLSQLWRSFLQLLPKNSVTFSPGVSASNAGVTPLEYLGGWSNTGYLELDIREAQRVSADEQRPFLPVQDFESAPYQLEAPIGTAQIKSTQQDIPYTSLHHLRVVIKTVNGKGHLIGLKRTRGVSSSKHEENQKTIESFFKKRKV